MLTEQEHKEALDEVAKIMLDSTVHPSKTTLKLKCYAIAIEQYELENIVDALKPSPRFVVDPVSGLLRTGN